MNEAIDVFIWPKKKVGQLWFSMAGGKQSSAFSYSKEWLEDKKQSFAIEPGIELYEGSFYSKKSALFGCIEDSSPDRWGKILLNRYVKKMEKGKARTLSELDYLLGVNDEIRQGALRYKKSGENNFLGTYKKSILPVVFLPKLLGASERFLKLKEKDDDLRILLEGGSSLGGARPKACVIDNGDLYMAKFPRQDDEVSVSAWESVASKLAQNSGINVAFWKLVNIAGKKVFLTRRFDRDKEKRIPFISAMTITGAKDNEEHGYLDIAYAIRKHGAKPKDDLEELWRRMVFNILVSNVDDHLRNHGFLLNYEGGGWVLSPAYDMNPVSREFKQNYHDLNIDGVSREGTVDNAFSVIGEFCIKQKRAEEIYNGVYKAVQEWEETARMMDIQKNEIETMRTAFLVKGNLSASSVKFSSLYNLRSNM